MKPIIAVRSPGRTRKAIPKSAYKFIHHNVGSDGTVGAANVEGCTAGCGVLNGAMGGTTIPDADRKGVWNHLAAHLKDADVTPPELKSIQPEREQRTFTFKELRVAGTAADPIIEGNAAVYGSQADLGYYVEEIEPGFFDEVLGSDARALFNHDSNIVLGRVASGTLALQNKPDGLGVVINPPNTTLVNDMVLTPMKRGDIDQMSFAFNVKEGGDLWYMVGDQVFRKLIKGGCAELYDVSVVTYPAYQDTSAHVRSKIAELHSQVDQLNSQPAPEGAQAGKESANSGEPKPPKTASEGADEVRRIIDSLKKKLDLAGKQ
jgi:HK97 family phage prohead protease